MKKSEVLKMARTMVVQAAKKYWSTEAFTCYKLQELIDKKKVQREVATAIILDIQNWLHPHASFTNKAFQENRFLPGATKEQRLQYRLECIDEFIKRYEEEERVEHAAHS